LRADYTYTVARDDIQNDELPRRPKNKASADAIWQATPALSFTGTLLYKGSWIDATRGGVPGVTGAGYATVNIAGTYEVGHGVTTFMRIDNVLNRQYQDPVGFDRPGIGVFAGVRIALDTGIGGR
jgi:vitamin B12 transporter